LTQIFVESCVDFEVAHLSVLMVWRLPYPEVPTLTRRLLIGGCGQSTYLLSMAEITSWSSFEPNNLSEQKLGYV